MFYITKYLIIIFASKSQSCCEVIENEIKMSFIYSHKYTVHCFLLISKDMCFHLVFFPSSSFSIPCRLISPLTINFHKICLIFFLFLLFLNDIFARYKILVWQSLFSIQFIPNVDSFFSGLHSF